MAALSKAGTVTKQYMKEAGTSLLSWFFTYETVRVAHIRNKFIAVLNRLLQLFIIGFFIGYVIVWDKGYQRKDYEILSAVTTKVKGVVFSDLSNIIEMPIGGRTWDVADYVIPPQDHNAFFVMTNVVPTERQSQQTCPEDPRINGMQCEDDAFCESIKTTTNLKGNGRVTGKCVETDFPQYSGTKVCEIYGWCPVENDLVLEELTEPVLHGSRNFTVFIKNNIEFPKFHVLRRNLPEDEDESYINNCSYNAASKRDRFCPVFKLESIVNGAGVDYENIAAEGGVVQILIDWTCNLDHGSDKCEPSYTFRRLDRGDIIAKGFNFRYSDQYLLPQADGSYKLTRNLYKAYGIRFIVTVEGMAGKFDIVVLLKNLASALVYLSVATFVTDKVLLYCMKDKALYRSRKWLEVSPDETVEVNLDNM